MTEPDGRIWRVHGTPLVPASAGSASGALAGRSIAVKDLFAVAGYAIGAGNPTWLAEAPTETVTAPAVQALLDAGAHVTGIARTDELAYSIAGVNAHYGTPPNGAVAGALPGGSSSGPASAVALGQADIGLGTDTGGSLRVPASYQGLWGLRTTHGAVSRAGLIGLAPSFDTVGWLTRNSSTLRDALTATRGDATTRTGDFVIPSGQLDVDDDVSAAFGAVAADFAPVTTIDVGDRAHLAEVFRVVQAAEAWQLHGAWITAHPGALAGAVAERFHIASTIDRHQASTARVRLAELRTRLDDQLGDRVLLLPSASSPAPRVGDDAERVRAATMRLTCVASICGRPALSVPRLTTERGSVGLCLIGPAGSDGALIDLGAKLSR